MTTQIIDQENNKIKSFYKGDLQLKRKFEVKIYFRNSNKTEIHILEAYNRQFLINTLKKKYKNNIIILSIK